MEKLRQIDKVLSKITKIKQALAADKRKWGGTFDDSRGLRYIAPGLYLQIQDYKGALRYFKWFQKNIPDDSGYPVFLFEWVITFFKTGHLVKAEKKALETFFSNTYLFDKFLGKEFLRFEKWEGSNWAEESLTEGFEYSKDQTELQDFVEWVTGFLSSDRFYKIANEFVDIEKQLRSEPVGQRRSELVERRIRLLESY